MLIDWIHFTPLRAIAGGMLIGCAALVLAVGFGQVAGISGILANVLQVQRPDNRWRWSFLLGLILSGLVFTLSYRTAAPTLDIAPGMAILAGLFVGFGTRLGSGCTSGHGVCGIARFSPRSIVATAVFMATGFTTTFVVRHIL